MSWTYVYMLCTYSLVFLRRTLCFLVLYANKTRDRSSIKSRHPLVGHDHCNCYMIASDNATLSRGVRKTMLIWLWHKKPAPLPWHQTARNAHVPQHEHQTPTFTKSGLFALVPEKYTRKTLLEQCNHRWLQSIAMTKVPAGPRCRQKHVCSSKTPTIENCVFSCYTHINEWMNLYGYVLGS